MKPSRIKDRILKALINDECKTSDFAIAAHLNVPVHTVYTLLKEMETRGHIETIETATVSTGRSATCLVRKVYPQAHHFQKRTSYRWEAIKEWWRNAPKNYWAIGTLFGLLTSNALLIAKLFSKEGIGNKEISPTITIVVKRDTTLQINFDSTGAKDTNSFKHD